MTGMKRVLALVAGLTMAVSCARTPVPPGETLRYRMPEDPTALDPFRAGDDNSLVYINQVFDGLVEYVPGTLDVRPAVAESWTVSRDSLTYTFKLRRGVRFHNGREVVAEDVVYSVRRALSKSSLSEKHAFLAMLSGAGDFASDKSTELPGVAATGPDTVVFTLAYPYDSFLTVLAGEAGSILPKEVYEDPAKGYLTHPVGCGPYRFESWEPRVSIVLTRAADYWKRPAADPSTAAIDRIEFRFIYDSNTALEEYRTGGVDFTQEIPPGQREKALRELPDDLHSATRFSILYVGFNHHSRPFKDRLLRRALLHAIDMDFIVKVLSEGKDRVAAGMIPPGMMGHDPHRAAPAYDPNLASRLIAEAGFPGGKGLPPIVYRTNETTAFAQITDRILADLSRIGLKVVHKTSDFGAFLSSLMSLKTEPTAFALYRMTWFADWPDPDGYLPAQFATGAVANFGLYHNESLDRIFEEARRERDTERRAAMYRDADTILMDDAAFIPIYWYGQDVLLKPRFTGLKLGPLGVFGIAWDEVRVKGVKG